MIKDMNLRLTVLQTITISLVCLCIYAFTPDVVSAQVPLASPCEGTTCSSCDLVDMGNNLIQWLIGVVTVLFAVVMAIAGFQLVTAGGNPSALQSAKEKFTNGIIGFIIILSAWLLVDTIMKGLVGNNGQVNGGLFWAEIECWTQTENRTIASSIEIQSQDTEVDGSTSTAGAGSSAFSGSYAPIPGSPAGQICYAGPDQIPNSPDDQCFPGVSAAGNSNLQYLDGSFLNQGNVDYTPPASFITLTPGIIESNPIISGNLRLCDVTRCDEGARAGNQVYIDPFAVAQLNLVSNNLGGLQVNSGYRSPGYNAALRQRNPRAAAHSRHQYGDAFDIAITDNNTQSQIQSACYAAGATNVYTYGSGSHVHCDWRGAIRPAPTSAGQIIIGPR